MKFVPTSTLVRLRIRGASDESLEESEEAVAVENVREGEFEARLVEG